MEDAEFTAQSAQKSKKKLEEDVADLQNQLELLSKSKKEVGPFTWSRESEATLPLSYPGCFKFSLIQMERET